MNNVGRPLVGLAAIVLAFLVVLSFAVTAAGQAPPHAAFPPVHGKRVAKALTSIHIATKPRRPPRLA